MYTSLSSIPTQVGPSDLVDFKPSRRDSCILSKHHFMLQPPLFRASNRRLRAGVQRTVIGIPRKAHMHLGMRASRGRGTLLGLSDLRGLVFTPHLPMHDVTTVRRDQASHYRADTSESTPLKSNNGIVRRTCQLPVATGQLKPRQPDRSMALHDVC